VRRKRLLNDSNIRLGHAPAAVKVAGTFSQQGSWRPNRRFAYRAAAGLGCPLARVYAAHGRCEQGNYA